MKRIVYVTVLLLVFIFNLSHAQDVNIDEALVSLSGKIVDNHKELRAILGDLLSIGNAAHGDRGTISSIIDDIEKAQIVYVFQNYLILAKNHVHKDEVKNYCSVLMQSLSSSKLELDNSYSKMRVSYPYLTNKAALHSVDKAKENLLDIMNEIKTTTALLDNAIKSVP
jgi:hypothetical protein